MNLQPFKSLGSVPVIVVGSWGGHFGQIQPFILNANMKSKFSLFTLILVLLLMIHQFTLFPKENWKMGFEWHSC